MINIVKAPKSKNPNANDKKKQSIGLKYNDTEKRSKDFMYKNLEMSNCNNCDFGYSNFDYVSFRGAHFKASNFEGCTFNFAEFINTNLKNSSMKGAVLKNAIFNSAKLEGVSFKGAVFENTIFVDTDISKAKNINTDTVGIVILKTMPQIDISEELTIAIINAMNNEYIKKSKIFDTDDGGINMLSVKLLLDSFDEKDIIQLLNYMSENLDREFHTLSYIIKYMKVQKDA